jgi:hypothetical protein
MQTWYHETPSPAILVSMSFSAASGVGLTEVLGAGSSEGIGTATAFIRTVGAARREARALNCAAGRRRSVGRAWGTAGAWKAADEPTSASASNGAKWCRMRRGPEMQFDFKFAITVAMQLSMLLLSSFGTKRVDELADENGDSS